MSKESALAMMSGTPAPTPSPTPVESSAPANPAPALNSTPFNHLAKKEAEFVRRRQEFKKEQESVAAEKLKLKEYGDQINRYNEMFKTDKLGALKMLGYSETDIVNFLADKPEPTPEERAAQAASEAAQAKIKEFEDNQAKRQTEELAKRDQSLIQGYKNDLANVVKTDPAKFEYCAHYGPVAEDLMYETTLAVLKESNGKDVLTPQEVAEMVENYYEEQDKLMSSFKKRLPAAPAQTTETPAPERTRTVTPGDPTAPQPKPAITKSRTLHSGATSTIASTRLKMNETRDEKRERLMNKLRGINQ